jgi:endoglucanase
MFRHVNLRLLLIPIFLISTLILGGLSPRTLTTPASPTQTLPVQTLPTQALPTKILPTQISPTTNVPWLSVSGRYLKDPDGKNVILRGVSLVDISVADSRTRHASALMDMATDNANGWYARVVRLPVYPDAVDGQPGWNANPDAYFTRHLDPAIQHCISKQIYCIIDWHYIKDYNSSTVDTATRAFWSYVAPKYASTPNVIFELYNEPIYPDSWSAWKTTAQPWVDLIRADAPQNLILIGGPRWSQNVAEAATSPFTGSNLMYVAHIYPGHGGQRVWDAWFGESSSVVPYFITEWGWQQGGSVPTSGTKSGYGIPFSAYLDSKGVSWTAWVFDVYWQPVMFDASWNLLGGETYMGQFTRDFLYQHRNDDLPGGGFALPLSNSPAETTIPPANPPSTPTNSSASAGSLKVQLITGGADNNQQSAFRYRLQNTGSSAQSNISIRLYFSTDGTQPASSYVLEKYYDQSGVATISGPTLAFGSTYYFTVSYGGTALPTGGTWEYETALRLDNWASNYSGANDWWHATGTLPTSYADWINIPVYVNGTLVWGAEPE